MPQTRRLPPVSATFAAKKAQVLSLLTQPEEDYSDKSPKGTVDAQIRDLINEINAYDGLVTTSSCAGRVAVFVEGPKAKSVGGGQSRPDVQGDEIAHDNEKDTQQSAAPDEASKDDAATTTTTTNTASPGGKGGGRWLYVSHDPITLPIPTDCDGLPIRSTPKGTKGESSGRYTTLFNLTPRSTAPLSGHYPPEVASSPQLVHLSFSPLILHIHCATLQHARPLLAAAINAGFRESGLQSLRILDDPEHGAMVAVRTAGLAFETVVGVVSQSEVSADNGGESEEERQDVMMSLVSEDYLSMCVGVVNERFKWNDGRRERFREELRKAMVREGLSVAEGERAENGWEDKDERRRRKRMEGLSRQRDMTQILNLHEDKEGQGQERDDGLDEGLGALGIE
ncbi:hypothetical protein LTS15_000952 [Exophiala xenobiotica]|nr:hypothetical protein LTS15_000952 [Exophiala xenobiotica]